MTAEFISVGTELLLGNIVNTNAQYLSQKCAELGLSVYYQVTVGDNEKRLEATIKHAINRSDVVILTGGLGPTEDDLTKETVAKAIGRKLETNEESLELIKSYFAKRKATIAANNYKQAEVIEGAIVLQNGNGTAPGQIVEDEGTLIILLPGPPNEMKPMFEEQVFPYLRKKNKYSLYSKMVKITGIGESSVEMAIKDLIDKQTNPTIAPYAKASEVNLRITASAKSESVAEALIAPIIEELRIRFGNKIFTTQEDETLAMVVVKLLNQKGLKVSTAESITGGLIVTKLTDCPGASNVIEKAYITYSDQAKEDELLVPSKLIEKYGVVSAETAEAMARGLYNKTGSDVTLGITGVYTRNIVLPGNRAKVREDAAINALDLIRISIQ
ncbi:MAG: competence/damage-inducible protein [Clostridiales bacterium]|nr:competence/damage-inducible protein [Clostridiales bacterium]